MKNIFFTLSMLLFNCTLYAQSTLTYNASQHSIKSNPKTLILNMVTDFGAKPNDNVNDSKSFIKASEFINARGGNVKLIVPRGTYIIGEQTLLKNKNYFLEGKVILSLNNVQNVEIEGENGTLLKYDVGLKFGSFNPQTENSTNNSWECKAKNRNISGQRATLGVAINIVNASNIIITKLTLDGNFYAENLNNMNSFDLRCVTGKNEKFRKDKINLGGAFGDCGVQLLHTGVRVVNSGDITIKDITSQRFGLDGIYVSNDDQNKKYDNVLIENCIVDYNARTGMAITGGNKISIINNTIKNTGRCLFIATGTGIDIEAQGKIGGREVKIRNLKIMKNSFKMNTSAEILNRYGNGSEFVEISNNSFEDVTRALHLSTLKNKNYKIDNNNFIGRKRILIDNKETSPSQLNSQSIKNINSNRNK